MSEKEHIAFIGLGGNKVNWSDLIKDVESQFRLKNLRVIQQSSRYKTAAWGEISQKDFTNEVWKISTNLQPHELLSCLLEIESKLGRNRDEEKRWGPRIIDLDIILYEDLYLKDSTLNIPHLRMSDRKFVLIPLVEIASETIHPILNKSMQELLEICEDDNIVEKL